MGHKIYLVICTAILISYFSNTYMYKVLLQKYESDIFFFFFFFLPEFSLISKKVAEAWNKLSDEEKQVQYSTFVFVVEIVKIDAVLEKRRYQTERSKHIHFAKHWILWTEVHTKCCGKQIFDMETLAIDSLLQWKLIEQSFLTTFLNHFLLEWLGEFALWAWEWKG